MYNLLIPAKSNVFILAPCVSVFTSIHMKKIHKLSQFISYYLNNCKTSGEAKTTDLKSGWGGGGGGGAWFLQSTGSFNKEMMLKSIISA